MIGALTPEQSRDADNAAIDSGTPSAVLMDRAGAAVASACLEIAGGAYGRRILILAGKGNNAGDGFCAANVLRRAGAFPVVVLFEEEESFSPDAAANFHRLANVRIIRYDQDAFGRELSRASVAIDALMGTGFRGVLDGPAGGAVSMLNASGLPVVAVDIPSGVDGLTGQIAGPAVEATTTVTMGAPKTGLLVWPGSGNAGELRVADIGTNPFLPEARLFEVEERDVARALHHRTPESEKRNVGTVLVIAGSVGLAGAAALVTRGAMRGGAGLARLAAPESVAASMFGTLNEATALPLPETKSGSISIEALPELLDAAGKAGSVVLGPGLSTNPETVDLIRKAISQIEQPIVIDADAINAFAGEPALIAERSGPTILTPHVRELARLMSFSHEEITRDRLGAARMAAETTESVVLVKGYRTIVAEPDGKAYVIPVGGPVLATGGSGDVLAGAIGAVLASHSDQIAPAAWAGAYLHGLAGDLIATNRGSAGVLAGEIADAIPDAMARIVGD